VTRRFHRATTSRRDERAVPTCTTENVSGLAVQVPTVVRLRPARATDAAPLQATHVAAIEAFGPDAYDERQVRAWASKDGDPDLALSTEDEQVVVAEPEPDDEVGPDDADRPAVAGFGHVALDGVRSAPDDRAAALADRDTAEVIAVYVHPAYARTGLGTRLLDWNEARARERDCEVVGLLASENAVGFYERRGYEALRKVTIENTGGVEMATTWMERELG
jgi:putative acetyltransferase